MKKLGVVITDGVGFRNFIMSNFITEASNQFETIFIYSGLPKTAFDALPENVEIKELTVFKEGKTTWFFRKWKEVGHLQKFRNFYGMKDNLISGYPKSNSARAILVKIIYLITRFVHSSRSILGIEKLQFLTFANNKVTQEYIELLKNDSPSHVFFTHQRPPYLAPFLSATIQLKIPVSSFIFSWDNLTSKGRMLGTFDYFLVWSQLMKEELMSFYPNVIEQNIKVVGTPQFEPYVMPEYESEKKLFLDKFKLDINTKIICFSCADASIGANDPLVIRTIAQAIRDKSIEMPVQLLVRTSPAEGPERFGTVKNDFPEIIWNYPKWILTRENHAESWSQRIPSREDIQDLRAILENVDLSINMCSTMSLDFMLFDKPVINAVFGNLKNGLYNDQRFLQYGHLKKVISSGAVSVANNESELIQQINLALKKPNDKSTQRKAMVDLQISEPLLGTSKRIATTLANLDE
ncbi:hypothetical protein [Flavobacterium ovatum]|uniref:hypothetical protein n=1 Tax=Flavobacterium ovatum TaxID=1928857 RepID=UPI00344C9690